MKLRYFRIAALSIGGIVIAGILIIHTPFARRYALSQLQRVLAEQGITLQTQGLNYNLLSMRANMRNVVLIPVSGMPPLLTIEALDANISMINLLRGKVVINDVALLKPEIFLVIDEQGRMNLPKASNQKRSSGSFLIDYATARGASLRIEDRKNRSNLFVPEWQFTVDGNILTNRHEIALQTMKPASLFYQGSNYSIDRLQTTIDLGDEDAAILGLNLDAMGATLRASGNVRDFKNPQLELTADANAKLDRLLAAQKITGDAKLQLKARGPIDQLVVNGHASVMSSVGRAVGDAELSFGQGTSRLFANLDEVQLDKVSRLSNSPYVVASRANGRVAMQWPGLDWQSATASADLMLRTTSGASRNVIPVGGSLSAQFTNGAGRVRLASVSALGAVATGTVNVDRQQRIRGSLQVAASNLAQTAELSKRVFATNSPMVGGAAKAELKLAGTVQRPQAEVHVSASPVTVGSLNIDSADLNASYRQDLITIRNSVVSWKGQQLRTSGTIQLGGPGSLDLTSSTENAQIADLLAAMNRSDVPISGNVKAEAKISGTTKAPDAVVSIKADDLVAFEQAWGRMDVDATVEDGREVRAKVSLQKTASELLQGEGSFNIDTEELTADLKSTPLQLTSLNVPGVGIVKGTIELQSTSNGSTSQPQVSAVIQARDLNVGGTQVGDVNSTLRYENGGVNAKLDAPKQAITAEGRVQTEAPYAFTLEARANGTELSSLPLPEGTPVSGKVSLTLKASGQANDTNTIDASVRSEQMELQVQGQPVRLVAPLNASLDDGLITIESASIAAPGTTLQVSGSMPLEINNGRSNLNINLQSDLSQLAKLAPPNTLDASGTLTAQGVIAGNLKAPEPDLVVKVAGATVSTPNIAPVTEANLDAVVKAGAVTLNTLSAKWMGATINGAGSIPFQTQAEASFNVSLKGLDFAQLKGAPEGLRGKLSATLDVSGRRAEIDAIQARLKLDELTADYERVHLEQDGISSVVLDQGVATVERFAVKGPNTQLALSGTAKLTGETALNLKVAGNTDIGIASLFMEDVRARGASQIELLAQGTTKEPRLTGSISLSDAELSIPSPRIAAEGLNLRADFTGQELRLTTLNGELNGGSLSGGGSLTWTNGQLGGPGLTLTSKNVYLDFPANLKTVSDLDLKFAPVGNRTVLSGNVQIIEGSYSSTLRLEEGLFNIANRTPELDLTEERSEFLSKLNYNVAVQTLEPLLVNNNLAKLEVDVNARLVGNYYSPGLTGRVNLGEGGELYLNERKYLVDRGVVTFISDQRIEPVYDLLARTEAAGYDITLAVSGGGRDRETTLTSDPPLPEPDIAAVLLTGRTLDQLQGQETEVAKEQVLSYLTGRVGGSVGRGIEKATGISQVKIEPGLIASESDPSARLTVGQNITRQLSLVYSMNLINSGDQIIMGQYEFNRRFRARTLKQSDNSYRFDFSRTQELGGIPPPPRTTSERENRVIGKVDIPSPAVFSEEQIRKWLNAREGRRYDFFKLRKGVDKIENRYADAGMLESKVKLRRDVKGSVVDVELDIDAGPKVDFVYEGFSPSRALRKKIREAWMAGIFDEQRGGDAAAEILKELLHDRHVEAKVEFQIDGSSPEQKRVTFDIQPGMKFESYKVVFAGATRVEESDLRQILRDQKVENEAITNPKQIIDLISRYYHELGFLDAKLARPELVVDRSRKTAMSVFAVAEGPRYRVQKLDFEGNQVYTDAELAEVSNLEPGGEYTPQLRQDTIDNLRSLYARKGYNDAEVTYSLNRLQTEGQLQVELRVNEGRQSVVQNIEVAGGRDSSKNFVRKQLYLKPGDAMDLQSLSKSRRELYSTGAFSLIDIDRSIRPDGSNRQPVDLKINVREVRPFLINYGGYFDTDRGPGGIVDLTTRNILGMARVAGVRVRYDRDLQEGRLYFSQPFLRDLPLRTTASSYLRREVREGFNTDRVGFSLLQEARFRNFWTLNYGYRLENTHTYEAGPDPLFDTKLRVAPFTASLSRDSRDDILDATRGQFISHAVDYAPSWSGSELNFVKYFGQYFRYISLDKPRLLPMERNVRRSRLILATGVRVGLAAGLNGQSLIPGRSSTGQVALGERFFAGGGTTVRGFSQDGIGPRLGDGISPTGGDALFIWNTELRFPIYKWFEGVGFTDFGNVYESVSDFRPWQVRKTAGLGLRIRTPYFLVRFDYGIKLDRKPGESMGRPFISIGQAF